MKIIKSQTKLAILCLMALGVYNANAVSCGPVADPCIGHFGHPVGTTVSWTCQDPETCGTTTCIETCIRVSAIGQANNCTAWIYTASNPCNSPS